ncbi:MAG: hypothetical protein RL571_553 [Pseudomonadota bacterium]|jgi:hypothetical protein
MSNKSGAVQICLGFGSTLGDAQSAELKFVAGTGPAG